MFCKSIYKITIYLYTKMVFEKFLKTCIPIAIKKIRGFKFVKPRIFSLCLRQQ